MAKPQNQQFTEDELKTLKDIRQSFSDISYKLGQSEMQRITLDKDKAQLVSELENTITKEKTIAKNLLDKYGKGTIDIDSGEFIPAS